MAGSRHGFTDEQLMEASDKVVESDDTTPSSVSLVISDSPTLTTLIALLSGSGISFSYNAVTGVLTIANTKQRNYSAWIRALGSQNVSCLSNTTTSAKINMDGVYGEGSGDVNTSTDRWTAPSAGTYIFRPFLNMNLGTPANFDRAALRLRKNDTTDYGISNQDVSLEDWNMTGMCVLTLSQGDYIEWYFDGTTNASGACTVSIRGTDSVSGNSFASHIYIEKIAS